MGVPTFLPWGGYVADWFDCEGSTFLPEGGDVTDWVDREGPTFLP